LEVLPRRSTNEWIDTYHHACREPFGFAVRPAIRFSLLESPTVSEWVNFCHHILCDGFSLAFLAWDLLQHLGNPAQQVTPLSDPRPVSSETLPQGVSIKPLVRLVVNRINTSWTAEAVYFDDQDQDDAAIHESYWSAFDHRMIPVDFSKPGPLPW
jgi:hypothetical protein